MGNDGSSSEVARPSTAPNRHSGPPTADDFHLAPFTTDFTPNLTGSPTNNSASSPKPRPFMLRHDSDPKTSTLAQRRANASGSANALDRRSVGFANGEEPHVTLAMLQESLQRPSEWEEDEGDRGRQASFFKKLKASFTPAHSRQTSELVPGTVTPVLATPQSERDEPRYPVSNVDGSEAEGDVEDSEMDDSNADRTKVKHRKKGKRRADNGNGATSSAPTTPKTPRFNFLRGGREPSDSYFSPINGSGSKSDQEQGPFSFLPRRATMDEIPEHDNPRAGVSEDEGRDRLAKGRWRRGLDNARGLSYAHHKRPSEPDVPGAEPRIRPGLGHMRRLTGLDSASTFRMRTDRQMSASAQKWKQVKAGLQMLGRREKNKRQTVDHQKSAELMAELLAGSPAAIFFASMYQRDEHGRRKIPVLLEQLKINIPTSHFRESKGERHTVFTINLEYGNGASRMTWTIHRSLRDFANLHLKYKFQSQSERYNLLKGDDRTGLKMPRFPRSAFPYLRGVRGLADDEDEDDENAIADQSGPDGDASAPERPTHKKRRRSSFAPSRRKSSGSHTPETVGALARTGSMVGAISLAAGNPKAKELYTDRQRKKLETYLQQMIKWLIFRPDANRLCKFLELSSLAMRLAVEGGYHGKEGLLSIISKPKIDIRRRPTLATAGAFKRRHSPKWFLIRHSYLVAVDSPESLEPREVFLVDADFTTDKQRKQLRDQSANELARSAAATAQPKHHLLKLYNGERKLKLLAKNERQLVQFKESIEHMQQNTIWSQRHRFDSFAPVRKNVFARWLVDGRDHMWQVSRAIDNARSFVYIHDWWLSPELYMRRPAAISQKWRLDRLLLRKAQEGVKIFVIVYRNIESAIPIDSEYTKASLLDLHPNICVQRSPNQFRQNQFFWAHHEKLVVVDNAMAFVGGVDLCFGRWDDPNHSLTDDKLTGFELDMDAARTADNCQVWPGKDYSNPRVQDFYALDRPYEEMYDRTKVPRMPWHDISMTIVGQPARDVGRHFVQRWNYILRQRVPSRPTPILLPPPEYDQDELERLGMTGTCQIQILRSATTWSIGTPNKTECSIMNAYVHLIKNSQHFVYIENQFFISSCVVEGTQIVNKIGDALVERAERAYLNGEQWRACIIIPLMPGFQNSVDSQDGTSVRLIMQCQYRSICRGESSIFARLRAKGINPQDYIEFYALRQWGKIGPQKCLTTEQLYIHAKCMVVDDRSVIIGSANINERSMLGSRDSEVAAIVTDQEMIPSYMGGKPYEVGTFPHTLRMRLMREHLGIDVDELHRREREEDEADEMDEEMDRIYNKETYDSESAAPVHAALNLTATNLATVVTAPEEEGKAESLQNWVSQSAVDVDKVSAVNGAAEKPKSSTERQHDLDVQGFGFDNMKNLESTGELEGRDSYVDAHGHEHIKTNTLLDHSRPRRVEHHHHHKADGLDTSRLLPPAMPPRMSTRELGLTQLSQLPALPPADDTDIGGPPINFNFASGNSHIINPLLNSMSRPVVEDDSMRDPLVSSFYSGIWHKVAENNTRLYRQVFRCMPDSEVQSWREYREFSAYSERFMQSQGLGQNKSNQPKEAPGSSGPPGSGGTDAVSHGVSVMSDKAGSIKKGRLSGLTHFLHRAKSNGSLSTVAGKQEQISEKQRLEAGSRASDVPTANGHALEDEQTGHEKAAAERDANDDSNISNGHTSTTNLTVDGAPDRNSASALSKSRTVQYADDDEKATGRLSAATSPAMGTTTSETTAIQSTPSMVVPQHNNSTKRRRRATTKSSGKPFFIPGMEDVLSKDEAEGLLNLTQGHLVLWPYDWLEREEKGGNWLYNIDQLAPLEIYD
ncbi:hypothetical protein BDV97DRAFT_365897 [Delphinella strobiligena]|nr:hypothetical protein BDV97DRAFT_365897 [Delphinella strobiligena]